MTHDEEIRICKMAAQTILRDGRITDAEMQLIDRLISGFGMTPEERRDILARNIDDDITVMARSFSESPARKEALLRMCEAVAVDGKVTPSERSLLLKCAAAMNVPEETLREWTAGCIDWT